MRPVTAYDIVRVYLAGVLLPGLVASPSILALTLWTGPTTLESNGASVPSGDFINLDPEAWIKKEFPLTTYLSPELDITRGDWTVFIYHHDCRKCQEAIPTYLALAKRLSCQGSGDRVLFLDVPTYRAALPGTRSVHYARLRDEHEWFVQTPIEILLTNGIVTTVSLELPTIATLQMAFGYSFRGVRLVHNKYVTMPDVSAVDDGLTTGHFVAGMLDCTSIGKRNPFVKMRARGTHHQSNKNGQLCRHAKVDLCRG